MKLIVEKDKINAIHDNKTFKNENEEKIEKSKTFLWISVQIRTFEIELETIILRM